MYIYYALIYIYINIYLFIYLYIYLFIYLFIYHYQLLPEEGRKQQLSWRDPGVSFHPRPAKTKWARSTRRLSDIWTNWYIPKRLNISNILVFSRTRTSSNSNEHNDRYSWDKKKWCLNIYSWWIGGSKGFVPVLLIIFSVPCEGPPRHVYRTHQDVQGPYTIHSFVRIWIYMYICAHINIKPQKDRTVFPGCCRWLRHTYEILRP